jgi:sterol desaturase/sphingolipid hydroxylase (fatty acid hydroxylase superfamily)
MPLLSIEHSTTAYRADFFLYGSAMLALGAWLVLRAPSGMALELSALVALGWLAWSPVEYALHRFVLHGLPPFKGWHREHHQRPLALICAPTALSASLIGLLVWLPAVGAMGLWRGSALTLGVLVGYLGYAITHHALHHWRLRSGWLAQRKHAHARHHYLKQPCCFGVTTGLWDRLFHTIEKKPVPVRIRVVRRQG